MYIVSTSSISRALKISCFSSFKRLPLALAPIPGELHSRVVMSLVTSSDYVSRAGAIDLRVADLPRAGDNWFNITDALLLGSLIDDCVFGVYFCDYSVVKCDILPDSLG